MSNQETNLSHWPEERRESVSRLIETRAALSSVFEKRSDLAKMVYVGGSVARLRARPDSDTDIVVFEDGKREYRQLSAAFEMVAEELKAFNSPFEVRLGPWEGEPLISLEHLRDWNESRKPAVTPPRLIVTLQGIYRVPERILTDSS